jgi:Fe-S-cluster-containing hydrogenase component 2
MICPFGTLMTDFFDHHRNKEILYDLRDEKELEQFIRACPEGTVTITDMTEMPDKNIYRLNEKVLIKDYLYTTEIQ